MLSHGGRVVLAACVIAAGTAGTYLNIYLPTYAHRHLHLALSSSFAITFLASLAPLLVTPVVAHWSDRVGRLPIMIWMAAILCVGAYPAFLAVAAHPTPTTLAIVLIGISIARAGYTAPSAALLAEMFPLNVRAAGMSLGYTLGVVVFGGFAQLLLEWLINATGNPTIPGLYMTANRFGDPGCAADHRPDCPAGSMTAVLLYCLSEAEAEAEAEADRSCSLYSACNTASRAAVPPRLCW